jgi:hypothetical protein
MKVPLMIAYLKIAESHPEILARKVVYVGNADLNAVEYYKPAQNLAPNQTYTIDELLSRMIKYSDNNAMTFLINIIDNKILNEVLTDLGMTMPQGENATLEDYLTVKQYAYFLECSITRPISIGICQKKLYLCLINQILLMASDPAYQKILNWPTNLENEILVIIRRTLPASKSSTIVELYITPATPICFAS